MTTRHLLIALVVAASAFPATSTSAQGSETRGHGPASTGGFSHVFSRRAHQPQNVQLSFHFGLLQPALLRGLNAAVDVRWKRLIVTASHGAGLRLPDSTLTSAERDAGMQVSMPWSTGFGIGLTLVDELYALVDFKVHDVQVRHDQGAFDYRTVTLGLELGYRLFLWRGLHVAPVIRFWPNVYSSLGSDGVALGSQGVVHEPIRQGLGGFFANVLVGWAFGVD
ncbi:MAG: hypothetical protein AAF411_01985 [Myxococcota bacterium]